MTESDSTTVSTAPAQPSHARQLHDAIERYHRPLVGYARHMLSDTDRAHDVAQDTLLKMCQQPADVFTQNIEPRLAAWLFTVCRNRAIDILRKESPMQPTSPTTLDGLAATHRPAHSGGAGGAAAGLGNHKNNPSQIAEQHDTTAALLNLVQTLPDLQREVIQLRFHGQLAYKQIAQVTGHSVSHVGVLLHEAIKNPAPRNDTHHRMNDTRGHQKY